MLLEAKNISLSYDDGQNTIKALKGVTLSLPETGLFGILGPSGSGKTSLLYLLSGIRKPTTGDITYLGYPFPHFFKQLQALRKREMGFVFQFHFLINYLSVEQNILVGANRDDQYKHEITNMLIARMGLTGLEKRFPFQLSGGQRQRVAIARSLAHRPKILFVDEPTASLDHKTGEKVIATLFEFSREACVVIVTHDQTNLTKAELVYEMWDGKLTLKKE